jgi:hypothetical protein
VLVPVAPAPEPALAAAEPAPPAEAAPAVDNAWSSPPPAEPVQEWQTESAGSAWQEVKKPEATTLPDGAGADWSSLQSGPDWAAPAASTDAAASAGGAADAWGAPPPGAPASEWTGPPPAASSEAEWSAPPEPPPLKEWSPPSEAVAQQQEPRATPAWNAPAVGASALEQLDSEPPEAEPGAAKELFGSVPAGGSLSGDDDPYGPDSLGGDGGSAEALGPPVELASPEEVLRPLGPPVDLASPEEVLRPLSPPVELVSPEEVLRPLSPPVELVSPEEVLRPLSPPVELVSPEEVLRPLDGIDHDDPDLPEAVPGSERARPRPQPLAHFRPATSGALEVRGEHRVAVHTRGGRTLRGTLRDVDLSKSQFPFLPQGGREAESIFHSDVKAIFFMLAPGEKPHAGEGGKVRVTFADGRVIEGTREGADAKHGFFLVPTDAARTNTRRIYVAREATDLIENR